MDDAGVTRPGSRAAREQELLRRYHEHGDERARDRLAEEMLPLARALASRYAGRGEPLDDLVQVACVGMMKAIEGFDLEREVRFSSYATPTVLGEIRRHFRDRTWGMRVPRAVQELQIQVARARERLTRENGRSPTVQELARAVGVSFEEVLQALQAVGARRPQSLDEPASDVNDSTLADSLGDDDPELERAEMRVLLGDALATLRPREREVLRLRFAEDLTQTEISRRVGVSQMQVSRILRESLERLRASVDQPPPRAIGPRSDDVAVGRQADP